MKRKYKMVTGLAIFALAAATGCGNGREQQVESVMFPSGSAEEQNQSGETGSNVPESQESGGTDVMGTRSEEEEMENRDIVNLSGTVRSIGENSVVISRIFLEDSLVFIPEEGSPEEEFVTVKCTETTVFKHWTIKGGGADILMKEASFSDIMDRSGLEMKGYFDGDDFVAEEIIIEVYE